ncbi:MAG TPA: hypothetical protein DCE41_29995 [Cytophagales bacterium]|nr:hypothetical protein [Cytophagales bacterium]HAA24255.1 hypothetical protein [Cytophagales bacterium]HAP60239.1 hypothetical protein [Cytophagales bacterium]
MNFTISTNQVKNVQAKANFQANAPHPFGFYPIYELVDLPDDLTGDVTWEIEAKLDLKSNLYVPLTQASFPINPPTDLSKAQLNLYALMGKMKEVSTTSESLSLCFAVEASAQTITNLNYIAGVFSALSKLSKIQFTFTKNPQKGYTQLYYLKEETLLNLPAPNQNKYYLLTRSGDQGLSFTSTLQKAPNQKSPEPKEIYKKPPQNWSAHRVITKLRTQLSDQKAAYYLSSRLASEVNQLQDVVSQTIKDLEGLLKIDGLKQSRIDITYQTFGKIVSTALSCIPGIGSSLQHVFDFMRAPNVADAWWLGRSKFSFIGQYEGDWANDPGNDELRRLAGLTTGKEDLEKEPGYTDIGSNYWENGKPGYKDFLAEQNSASAISDMVNNFPSGDFNAQVDAVGLGKLTNPSLSDVLALIRYKQMLLQLHELESNPSEHLIFFIFAQLVSGSSIGSRGVSISDIGGWKIPADPKNPKGRLRMAMGKAEMKTALGTTQLSKLNVSEVPVYNQLVASLEKSTWIYQTKFSQAQSLLQESATQIYTQTLDMSEKDAERLVLFKTKMACYRDKLEDVWAKKPVGEGVKQYLKSTFKIDDEKVPDIQKFLTQQGFGNNHTWSKTYKVFWGRSGILRRGLQLVTLNQAFSTTASAKDRAKIMVDAYIFHRILELHLGTPWPVSMPYESGFAKRVIYAITDAYLTMLMTRVNNAESKPENMNQSDFEALIPSRLILESQLVRSFFSPAAQSYAYTSTANPTPKFTSIQSQISEDIKTYTKEVLKNVLGFYDSIPSFSTLNQETQSIPNPFTVEYRKNNFGSNYNLNSPKLTPRLGYAALFLAWGGLEHKILKPLATWVSDQQAPDGQTQEGFQEKNQNLVNLIEKALWAKGPKENTSEDYLQWIRNRAELDESREHFEFAEQLGAEYQVKDYLGQEDSKTMQKFRAQQVAMQLLINDQEDPKVAMKLMQDSMKEMLRLISALGTEVQELAAGNKGIE